MSPQNRGYSWQRLCWGDQLLAKGPEDVPRARWANQKQHGKGHRYTHFSLTLSQVTQSRMERNKNKELVRPQRRQEQAPGPSGRGARQAGRQAGTTCPLEGVLICVCVWKGGDGGANCRLESSGNPHLGCPGPSSRQGNLDYPRGLRVFGQPTGKEVVPLQ